MNFKLFPSPFGAHTNTPKETERKKGNRREAIPKFIVFGYPKFQVDFSMKERV